MALEEENGVKIDALLLDFGGVLAEEGFQEGLRVIAEENNIDPKGFIKAAFDLVYQTGYVLGKSDENTFWKALQAETGLKGDKHSFREMILSSFILRKWMVQLLPLLKKHGIILGILSDQTEWLDYLNERDDFYKWFDHIFNSYYLGKTKRDPTLFDDIVFKLNIPAGRILFVDDSPGNIKRAEDKGLQTFLYINQEGFMEGLFRFCPVLKTMQTSSNS